MNVYVCPIFNNNMLVFRGVSIVSTHLRDFKPMIIGKMVVPLEPFKSKDMMYPINIHYNIRCIWAIWG